MSLNEVMWINATVIIRNKRQHKNHRTLINLSTLLWGLVHFHLPLLQKILQVQIENIDAFGGQMDAVCPIQARVCATPDVVVGQRGAAQLWGDVLDPAIHCGSDQIYFVAVSRVAPCPPREDVGPHEDAVWEDAPHGGQVLLDRGQQVGGAVSAQVVAAQVYDEDIWVGPGDLQLVELGQELGPCHALDALPPDGHLAGVHAQLHTYLRRLGPWLCPVHQRMTTNPNVFGLTADWLAYKL